MNRKIRVGISTCPNDTFAFHGLMTGKVTVPDIELQFELLDVQQLNERLLTGDFDIAKGSFHAALLLSDKLNVLDAGSALGFGNGPLLLAGRKYALPSQPVVFPAGTDLSPLVLCPGEHTTANLLYRLFYPEHGHIENVVFSEIMPRLQNDQAEYGVCIHEGRFTWQEEGLALIADLGELWEQRTGAPLPLGGIFASKNLDREIQTSVSRAIRQSIEYSFENREETLQTMRSHAQEFSDDVLFSHVDLYVNDWTLSLTSGNQANDSENPESGVRALRKLAETARDSNVIPRNHPDLEVVGA